MNHLRLRHFLLGFAHANSAPPDFTLKDVELYSPHITSQINLDECEDQMMQICDGTEWWYHMGRLADEGYTLKAPNQDGECGTEDLLCFKFLEETI